MTDPTGTPTAPVATDTSDSPDTPALPEEFLAALAARVQQQVHQWADTPCVSIGQARALTTLKETSIRYFETLGVLHPQKARPQSGSSRLYTLTDLRRLYALALLINEHQFRPAEAARIVTTYHDYFEQTRLPPLPTLLSQESNAITDGFLLARLMSQVLDAVQIDLTEPWASSADAGAAGLSGSARPDPAHPRVVGLIFPVPPTAAAPHPHTSADMQALGRNLSQNPHEVLVALDRQTFIPPSEDQDPIPALLSGRNDTTVLFYSPEAWTIPVPDQCRFCLYIPAGQPHLATLFMVVGADAATVPPILTPRVPTRDTFLQRLLALSATIFAAFRSVSLTKNYRYRSDGFALDHTQATYGQILATIRRLIFPHDADDACMAVLFVPNDLTHPTMLTTLAHRGYDPALAARIRLDLTGEGQGLSGRAYKLREPFLSLTAGCDPRVAYAPDEQCQVALAVPLATTWGTAPFGVLYLASRNPATTLSTDLVYVALILGTIVSELLGRWWLTRLRRMQDQVLHDHIAPMVRWLDSLDQHGPDFQRALDQIQNIWQRIDPTDPQMRDTHLALVVLDIDKYREHVQTNPHPPLPVQAQQHVRAAIRKLLPEVRDYWFKNDHVLVILEQYDAERAERITRRIANQVRAVPLDTPAVGSTKITISVRATIKVMTYEDLYDLDQTGGMHLRAQLQTILDDLRKQTAHTHVDTIRMLVPAPPAVV
ncbi:MAG: MerR family transcriptional regulator [Chloroflexaceae bacterium]